MEIEEVKNKILYVILCKNKPCCDCGNKYHFSQMQFDHVPGRGEKIFELSDSKKGINGHSLEEIKQEMEKCDLVCANCHSLRTFKRHLHNRDDSFKNITDEELFNLTNEQIAHYHYQRKNFKSKEYREKRKEKDKQYRKIIKERQKEYNKQYREENK